MLHALQRFPTGIWGAALLAQRLSAASFDALVLPSNPAVGAWAHALCLILAAGLAVGVATPICALASIVMLVACDLPDWSHPVQAIWAGFLAATAMLGGGGFSLDARLFGKRVIRING